MREYTRRPEEERIPFHVWLAQNWIGHHDYLAANVCKKIAHSPRKMLTKFAHNEQIYCEQQFAHRESILPMENHELPFILLAI
jgi:hypothetical protein